MAKKKYKVSLDIETKNTELYGIVIWMLAIKYKGRKYNFHNCYGLTRDDIPDWVAVLLEDDEIEKLIHNGGFDVPRIEMRLGIKIRNIKDTYLQEVVIQGIQIPKNSKDQDLYREHSAKLEWCLPRYGLRTHDKEIVGNFIDREPGIPFTRAEINYPLNDVEMLEELDRLQWVLLEELGLGAVAELENATLNRVCAMKFLGIGFDESVWRSVEAENMAKYKKLMAKLPLDVDNWNSPAQVKKYFATRGIDIGSFDELDELERVIDDEVFKDFLAARSLFKSVTAYGLSWLKLKNGMNRIDPDGRIRGDFQQILNTGRFSMNEPNLQQLPAKGRHREAFVPRPGCVFVVGDFTGQEIGVMAAASGEKAWIDAILRGDDIHSFTARGIDPQRWERETVKGCKYPLKCECPGHKEHRTETKTNNFMMAYGGGPLKLHQNTGIPLDECKRIVKKHKAFVSRLTRYLDTNGRDALRTGVSYSADPYQRRRVLMGEEEWQVVNQGKNNPIQAAGANMLKLAMSILPDWLDLVLVIHDEMILEVPIKNAAKACRELKVVMEMAANYITGIEGLVTVTPHVSYSIAKDAKLTAKQQKALSKIGKFNTHGELVK